MLSVCVRTPTIIFCSASGFKWGPVHAQFMHIIHRLHSFSKCNQRFSVDGLRKLT